MKTNRALKEAHLPRCDWRTFLKFTGEGEIPQKDVEALDHYFQHFVPPGNCIKCGYPQGTDSGSLTSILLNPGRFRFGLVNGEGQCCTGDCGWPARAIHRDVGPLKTLELILQYHPDVVTWEE